MKKFKRLFFNLCVICLTLFVCSSNISAFVWKDTLNYKLSTLNYNASTVASVDSNVWGSTQRLSNSSAFQYVDVIVYNPIEFYNDDYYDFYFRLAFSGGSILSYIDTVYAKIGDSNTWKEVSFVKPYGDYISCEGTLYNEGEQVNYIRFRYKLSSSQSVSSLAYFMNILEVSMTEASELSNSLENDINNVNSEISNINNSVSTLYSSVGSLENEFVVLNNDLDSGFDSVVEAVGTVTAGITSLGDIFTQGIGTITAGISNLFANSNSIKDMVLSIADSVASIELDFKNWWIEYTENYTYELMALNNINNSVKEQGAIISADLVNVNNSLYTCTNAVNSTLNALNTDIQEQMIAQTSNVTNSIVAQTNSLNESIKTMENAIVIKLDETLVVKDKTNIDSNDSSTEELESAITDYDNVEKNLVTDFNESLDSIDTDSASSIYSQNDFIKTAQFISTNMQNVYESNDFVGGMIDVTLLLGLIFTVIGIGVR